MDASAFLAHQEKLVEAERTYDLEETQRVFSVCTPAQLAKRGLAILGLTVIGMKTGAGGKSIVDLELSDATSTSPILPAHRLRVGDIVGLEEHAAGSKSKMIKSGGQSKVAGGFSGNIEGVVFKVTETTLTIAIQKKRIGGSDDDDEEVPKEIQERCRVLKLANNVSYERMLSAVKFLRNSLELQQASNNSLPLALTNVLFGNQEPSFDKTYDDLASIKFLDPTLNDSQREAVRFALGAEQVALIHGPPGTGKTFTVVEIVRQLVLEKKRVLVCGPSNISVDNLVERLAQHRVKVVRTGHPARLLPTVLNHSVDVLSRASDQGRIVNDIRVELDETFQKIQKCKFRSERRQLYSEVKQLRKDFRTREKTVISDIVKHAEVVLSTLNGCGAKIMWGEKFDVVVIDEATQALEAECWIAISRGAKVILAGDHLQLPPTVISEGVGSSSSGTEKSASRNKPVFANAKFEVPPADRIAIHRGDYSSFLLSTTMFERLLGLYHKNGAKALKRTLTTQYRMNDLIMRFPSRALYQNLLQADESCKDWLLKDLNWVRAGHEDVEQAVVFLDTSMANMQEETEDPGLMNGQTKPATGSNTGNGLDDSKLNRGEAQATVDYVKSLLHAGVSQEEIGIITPYSAQTALLKQLLKEDYPDIEIGTVDGFQGREKQAVILTLVRSNDEGDVGFLADRRRLNVAMTRAKRQLCVIGNSETLAMKDGFLKSWMNFLNEFAEVRYLD